MILRRTPEDFVVREVLRDGFVRDEPAAQAVYTLTKKSLTTQEAVVRLAKAMGTRAGEVHAAGLKDKHAVTTQHVSCEAALSQAQTLQGPGWSATRAGWCDDPLDAEAIERNEFMITVREMTKSTLDRARHRARERAVGGALVYANLYGEQRFGSNRHGEGFAVRAAIKGDYERALKLAIGTPARKDSGALREFTRALATDWGSWKKLRRSLANRPQKAAIDVLADRGTFQEAFAALPHFDLLMMVEAYQSELWNRMAQRYIARMTGDAEPHPRARVLGEWADIPLPTLGPETQLSQAWAEDAKAVLQDEGFASVSELVMQGVRRPKLGTVHRDLLARATGFRFSGIEADDLAKSRGANAPQRLKATLEFSLARGSYATVVVESLR